MTQGAIVKVRHRGLAKNAAQLHALFALVSLYKVTQAAHAGAHTLRLNMHSTARTRPSRYALSAPPSACAMESIFLRWWIEVTKPGKTRGLVSVSTALRGGNEEA